MKTLCRIYAQYWEDEAKKVIQEFTILLDADSIIYLSSSKNLLKNTFQQILDDRQKSYNWYGRLEYIGHELVSSHPIDLSDEYDFDKLLEINSDKYYATRI